MTHCCSGSAPTEQSDELSECVEPLSRVPPLSGTGVSAFPSPKHGIYGESMILWSPLFPSSNSTDVSFQNLFSLASTVTLLTSPAFINKALLRHGYPVLSCANYFLASRTQAAVGMLIVQPDSKTSPPWPLFCFLLPHLTVTGLGGGPQRSTREVGFLS